MEMKKDGSNQSYIDIINGRVTLTGDSWSGGNRALRFQAYKGIGSQLHRGAEFPISSKEEADKIIEAISKLLIDGKPLG